MRTGCGPSLRLVVYRCIWLTMVLRQPKDDAIVFISTCVSHGASKPACEAVLEIT